MKSHLLERIPTHCPSARECQCYQSRPASRNTLEKSECSQRLSRRLVAGSEQSVGGSPDWMELLSLNLQPALLSALQESFMCFTVVPLSLANGHAAPFPIPSLLAGGRCNWNQHASFFALCPARPRGPRAKIPVLDQLFLDGFSIILISIVLTQNPSNICLYQYKNNYIINTYIHIYIYNSILYMMLCFLFHLLYSLVILQKKEQILKSGITVAFSPTRGRV